MKAAEVAAAPSEVPLDAAAESQKAELKKQLGKLDQQISALSPLADGDAAIAEMLASKLSLKDRLISD